MQAKTDLVRQFIVSNQGSGVTCSFGNDDWTSLGPLVELTRENSPRISGLPLDALVADAVRNGDCCINLVTFSFQSPMYVLQLCLRIELGG